MTQLTLFPEPTAKPSKKYCKNFEEATIYAKNLQDEGVWSDITIVNPDPEKQDRIVQAVRI